MLGVSSSTLRRWEDPSPDGTDPTPEDVQHMERVYGADNLCYRWMRATIEPLRDMLPPLPDISLPEALLQFYVEHADMDDHRKEAMRDAVDGKIDDPSLRQILMKDLADVQAAAFTLRQLLIRQERNKNVQNHRKG